MNRIIRENYPASKLPEDLRAGMRSLYQPSQLQLLKRKKGQKR